MSINWLPSTKRRLTHRMQQTTTEVGSRATPKHPVSQQMASSRLHDIPVLSLKLRRCRTPESFLSTFSSRIFPPLSQNTSQQIKPAFGNTSRGKITTKVMNRTCNASAVQLDRKQRPEIEAAIAENLDNCLLETQLDRSLTELGQKQEGKVRDTYTAGDELLLLVTTDRQSAFDRILAAVPFKGQVLNQTSAWWFENTRHITANAYVSSPDPNCQLAKKCQVFPVEFVVRGFITGTTSTSLWTVYRDGCRSYCGNELPEGLRKNDKLTQHLLTPTTKAADHDEPVTPAQIVERGLMSKEDLEEVERRALRLFAFGQEVSLQRGLLLVDTKYEFGRTSEGEIVLLDEVHTPDSSRYWVADSYEARHAGGMEPENIDKEFLRLWFRDACDPYNDEVLPQPPVELITELSWRYIALYEAITGQKFRIPDGKVRIDDRIVQNLKAALR